MREVTESLIGGFHGYGSHTHNDKGTKALDMKSVQLATDDQIATNSLLVIIYHQLKEMKLFGMNQLVSKLLTSPKIAFAYQQKMDQRMHD